MHLLALSGPFTDPNDKFPYPFVYDTSTSELLTLSYTFRLKKVSLSSEAHLV